MAVEKYWKAVGVYGVVAEKGSEIISRVLGTGALGAIAKKLISPGQKDGGANSAQSAERRSNAMEYFNNQSEDIGR